MTRKSKLLKNEKIVLATLVLEDVDVCEKFGITKEQLNKIVLDYQDDFNAILEEDKKKRKDLFVLFDSVEKGLKAHQEKIDKIKISKEDVEPSEYFNKNDAKIEQRRSEKSFIVQSSNTS